MFESGPQRDGPVSIRQLKLVPRAICRHANHATVVEFVAAGHRRMEKTLTERRHRDQRNRENASRLSGGVHRPANLVGQGLGHHLIRVKIEQPIMTTLVFSETLLKTIPGPSIEQHASAQGLRNSHRIVTRTAIDHHHFVSNLLRCADAALDVMGLVESPDVAGNRCHRWDQSLRCQTEMRL